MYEYTSTLEGFQRAMEWSLTRPLEESLHCAETMSMPTFYHVIDGRRSTFNAYVRGTEEWCSKVSEYKLVMTIQVDGADTTFESFMFARVEEKSGKWNGWSRPLYGVLLVVRPSMV